ncbi:AAA family ATPase [Kocuria sp. CPCC 205236]
MELPAGSGKTEIIAQLVNFYAQEGKRALILTHTHAGVDVIRRRLRRYGVNRQAANVQTLDSWCFGLIASFPDLADINVGQEPDWALSRHYHEAGRRTVLTSAIIRMLQASYELLVVDEYQDCQVWQHGLVTAVSEVVPTCVFGDRMQGLLYFGDSMPVEWETEVWSEFPPLNLPVRPWRWVNTNPLLGEWLLSVRNDLLHEREIDFRGSPIKGAFPRNKHHVLHGQPPPPDTTVAISQSMYSAAALAQRLGGSYTMIEEIEGKHLRSFAEVIDRDDVCEIASATVQYAVDCAFGVADVFGTGQRRRLAAGTSMHISVDAPEVHHAMTMVNALLFGAGPAAVRRALVAISRVPKFRPFRREAWFGMLDALRIAESTDDLAVLDAVISIRQRLSLLGRRPETRIVGRPLLVKGLEFDHAVIDGPPWHPYDAHQLYVCLTRGSRSVTLITEHATISPTRPRRQTTSPDHCWRPVGSGRDYTLDPEEPV